MRATDVYTKMVNRQQHISVQSTALISYVLSNTLRVVVINVNRRGPILCVLLVGDLHMYYCLFAFS